MAAVRISGRVLDTERLTFGTGDKAFTFTAAKVQTGKAAITEVRFTDRYQGEPVREGDTIDVEAEVQARVYRGDVSVQVTATREYQVFADLATGELLSA